MEGKKIASRTDRFEAKSFHSPFLFPFLSLRLSVSFALEESSFQKPKGLERKSEVILKVENESVISEK